MLDHESPDHSIVWKFVPLPFPSSDSSRLTNHDILVVLIWSWQPGVLVVLWQVDFEVVPTPVVVLLLAVANLHLQTFGVHPCLRLFLVALS